MKSWQSGLGFCLAPISCMESLRRAASYKRHECQCQRMSAAIDTHLCICGLTYLSRVHLSRLAQLHSFSPSKDEDELPGYPLPTERGTSTSQSNSKGLYHLRAFHSISSQFTGPKRLRHRASQECAQILSDAVLSYIKPPITSCCYRLGTV